MFETERMLILSWTVDTKTEKLNCFLKTSEKLMLSILVLMQQQFVILVITINKTFKYHVFLICLIFFSIFVTWISIN